MYFPAVREAQCLPERARGRAETGLPLPWSHLRFFSARGIAQEQARTTATQATIAEWRAGVVFCAGA